MMPLLLVDANAQEVASVNWALTEAEGIAVTSATGAAAGIPVRSETLEVRDYSGDLSDDSVGPLGPYQRWWLGGEEWPIENTPDANRYVEFVVTPEGGGSLHVTEIALVLNAGGTGELRANLFYDLDSSFSAPLLLEGDIAVSRDAIGNFSYAIDETLNGTDSLYFRVYPWLGGGNASATRYMFLQDVTISGMGTGGGSGQSGGVNWALTEADTTSLTQASAGLGGAPARASDLSVRDYSGDLRDANDAVGPLGPFQRWWRGDGIEWPVTDDIDPNRYVEFVAGAEEGSTFQVTGVSMYVHGDGTSEMMASVFYSTNADFSDPAALEENFNAGDGDFGGPTLREYDVEMAIPAGDSIYVRVYPYLGGGNASAGRYLLLQDVTIEGEAVAPPPAVEGGYWSLTADDTTSVSATSENVSAAPVRGVGIMVRNYADDSDPGPGPLGAIQRWWLDANWPDESAPNPDRYIEFAVGTDAGFVFDADVISLYMGSHGTSNMTASLYYATNAAFSDSVALVEALAVPRSTLDFFSYDIDLTVPEGETLYFRIYPYLPDGSTSAGKYLLLQAATIGGTAIDANAVATEELPDAMRHVLHPSFPNPARSTATVRYELAEATEVQLELFNILGQRVGTLAQGLRTPGLHDATIDAHELAAGVYFVRLRAGSQTLTQQVVLAR